MFKYTAAGVTQALHPVLLLGAIVGSNGGDIA
ncbi:hypothetical protein SAMN05216274_104153 [Cryobacterium levicorallinum]|uniref:Uncharacterized protein n=1 Tax=Cryobacterium levicorallinum TaxID=995038 RepID=A0ABY1EBW3_9MICO|nr:hypothetical protein SAMN05216274_104153 [Cryobacterium levicorallinum]